MRQRVYNPAQLSDAELKASFVARQRELDELLRILGEEPEQGPLQHLVILGQRGMGKTTLGLRFLHAVREDSAHAARWQPVPFYEESYGIGDLADLWMTALRHLSDATEAKHWKKRADDLLERERDPERLAAYALDALADFRRETGRRLILFIESLDGLFTQLKDPGDLARLRAVMQERSDFLILGTASSVFPQIARLDEPLYESFRLVRLNGLDEHEVTSFLRGLSALEGYAPIAEILEKDPGRIGAIRMLTGGNPRLIALAARLMVESPQGKVREDIERLIDEQTPYFKARIESLPPQARQVFHALAEGWRPMLAREVASKVRLSVPLVSSQLKRLVNLGFVEEQQESNKRIIRYQVLERFYNIYYLMRFDREKKKTIGEIILSFPDLIMNNAFQGAVAGKRNTMAANLDAFIVDPDNPPLNFFVQEIAGNCSPQGEVGRFGEGMGADHKMWLTGGGVCDSRIQ